MSNKKSESTTAEYEVLGNVFSHGPTGQYKKKGERIVLPTAEADGYCKGDKPKLKRV